MGHFQGSPNSVEGPTKPWRKESRLNGKPPNKQQLALFLYTCSFPNSQEKGEHAFSSAHCFTSIDLKGSIDDVNITNGQGKISEEPVRGPSSHLLLLHPSFFDSVLTFHFEKNSNLQKSCKNSTPYTKLNSIGCSPGSLILSRLLSLWECVCTHIKNARVKHMHTAITYLNNLTFHPQYVSMYLWRIRILFGKTPIQLSNSGS